MSGHPAAGDDALAARTRHRIVNSFHFLAALARMRAQKGQDTTPGEGLLWMADIIADLGVLERHVSGEGVADIQAYLAGMLQVWRDRHRRQGLAFRLEACPLTLNEGAAPAFALVVLELVAMAARHGVPGTSRADIGLSLAREADGPAYTLQVSPGPDPTALSPDTFGMWLAESLARQIRGTLTHGPHDSVLRFIP